MARSRRRAGGSDGSSRPPGHRSLVTPLNPKGDWYGVRLHGSLLPTTGSFLGGDETQRNPTWEAALSGAPLPRAPGRYRVQYWSLQRNDPPRWTRLATPGSLGS